MFLHLWSVYWGFLLELDVSLRKVDVAFSWKFILDDVKGFGGSSGATGQMRKRDTRYISMLWALPHPAGYQPVLDFPGFGLSVFWNMNLKSLLIKCATE